MKGYLTVQGMGATNAGSSLREPVGDRNMRLFTNRPEARSNQRAVVRLSLAAAALIAAFAVSGCITGGAGGVNYYQNNLSMGCRVTEAGITICPGGRTAQQ
jgi:hypothetical protein